MKRKLNASASSIENESTNGIEKSPISVKKKKKTGSQNDAVEPSVTLKLQKEKGKTSQIEKGSGPISPDKENLIDSSNIKKITQKSKKNKTKIKLGCPKIDVLDGPRLLKEVKESPVLNDVILKTKINERLAQVSRCTLTLKNIPHACCTLTSLQSLMPEMIACVLPFYTFPIKPKGIAFVEFPEESLVSKYEDYFKNNKVFKGVRIKTSPINSSTEADDYILNKLMVRGFSHKVNKQNILNLFPKAIDIWFPAHERDKKIPKTATLTFNTIEDAFECFESHRLRKEKLILGDRPISVLFAPKEKEKRDLQKLVAQGLNNKFTDDHLRTIFPQAAKIERTSERGFALTYTDEEDCKIDRERANRTLVDGKRIRVFNPFFNENSATITKPEIKTVEIKDEPAAMEEDCIPSALFVSNMNKKTTEEEIKSIFPDCVKVEYLSSNKKNHFSGYCIVHFKNPSDAASALTSCQNRLHRNKPIRITNATKTPKKISAKQKKNKKSKKFLKVQKEESMDIGE